MSGDVLDLILIALAAAFAVAGYRQGFIVGILSFAGFLGGAAIGASFAPKLARSLVQGSSQQALVAIVAVFVAAMIGQLLASAVGAAVRSRVNWRPATLVDSIAGAAVSVLSVLLIAWLIGTAVVNAPFAMVTNQVNRSAVLRAVDGVMPSAARTMFSDFRSLLASGPYVQVFGALGAEPALTVAPPDPAVLNSAGLITSRDSIVKVMGIAPSCSRRIEGSGFVISPQHILTNAHVVAGVTQDQTVTTRLGRRLAATVVLFDPERDLAVLYVPGLRAGPLGFAAPASLGASAIVAGYPLDHSFTVVPARVGVDQPAQAPDIYQSHEVTRQIYSIRANVEPGNSGGPLLAPDGKVDGVVFAAAVGVKDTGYALTASEVQSDVDRGAAATTPASTQACD
ncbi:MAG: MarP family serine protease [Streptosporangiales bacterium]